MPKPANIKSIIPIERIVSSIYIIRDQKVMLDSDLADLYGVPTKALNQAVKRNIERFPEDFMFQLTQDELENWRSQIVTSNPDAKMALRRLPFAFTEHGALMLSSVLKSEKAVSVSIDIVRTFARLRQVLSTQDDVIKKLGEHDHHIKKIYGHIEKLIKQPNAEINPIGYIWNKEDKK